MKQQLDTIVYELALLGYYASYKMSYPQIWLTVQLPDSILEFTFVESDLIDWKTTMTTYTKILKGISEVG